MDRLRPVRHRGFENKMNYKDLMKELESLGNEQYRKTYRRHGVKGDLFGISFAHFGTLKKKIKTDHELAIELWKSGNYDARVLATIIADPAKGASVIDDWVKDVDGYAIGDAVAAYAIQISPDRKKIEKWMKNKDEWISFYGWQVFARLARRASPFSDDELAEYLGIIERDIHQAKNFVKFSMNAAVISIGVRNEALQKKALAAAARIGTVDVDWGDTYCKTPDAATSIKKTFAHQKAKAAKAK